MTNGLIFEPSEPSELEEGCVACMEGRKDAAARHFERVVMQAVRAESDDVRTFLGNLLHVSPQTDQEWAVQAHLAPTKRLRFMCFKVAATLHPQSLVPWQEMVALYKETTDDIDLRDTLFGCVWNAINVNTPPRVLTDLLHASLSEERLLAGEQRAAQIRAAVSTMVEPIGVIIRRYRDWAVTTHGVEGLLRPYDIYWRDVWSSHWESHLQRKEGGLGSYTDFLHALTFARSFFPVPSSSPSQAQQAQIYKRQFKRFPSDHWFEQSRIHTALGGVHVRSKSEVIIANMLTLYGIPFTYETRLEADDGTFRVPDFTLFRGEKTYYWEHLGMLENESYLDRWEQTLQWYRDHNVSRTLIVTTEAGGLDCTELLRVLQKHFL
ncbi:MAG: hypothetical protein H0U76_04105 [Ktedonobacteraceae bacterium]|nr:hypothetical protein [Ktedonobacteraceae bacterium]